jgi:two-component system, OmpR family, alkaline phosphatase synthesis response regulator PhoP
MENTQTDKSKILIVEDEESLATGLEFNLQQEGYKVKIAKDGREALQFFGQDEYDLIILDIMLPYLNGFEIAEKIRETDAQIPILILTAKTNFQDKLKGLEIGADDYLTKPFHLEELILRVKGMLKRKSWYKTVISEKPVYSFGNNEINFKTLSCKNANGIFNLTKNEAMVLRYLIDNKDKVVSRKELLENVWHVNPDIETRTVDIFISHLRKYLEPDPSKPTYIKSIRSAGYMFCE